MPKASFMETYGAKPIFAGVYTTASADAMRAEVELFLQNGINVYVESLRSRNDASFLEEDMRRIETVLERTADIPSTKGMPKIGINFLFHPNRSLELANRYGLSFIANDAAIGTYEFKGDFADRNHALPNTSFPRSAHAHLFAGMTPGYLVNTTPDEMWLANLHELHTNADVILVGDRRTQSALEQLSIYRQDPRITKPLIAAQGVNAANITEFFQYADGAIIGSGFRDDGKVSLEKIREIKRLQALQ
jgi:predicted TIM-barrel enzyme